MPDDNPNETPALDWQSAPQQFRDAHQATQERLREMEQQRAENDQVRRENMFLRAGVDIESPLGQLFAKGYDGELDMEVVKASWAELAPGNAHSEPPTPPTAQAGEELSPEQMAQQAELTRQRAALNSEAVAPGEEPTPDPRIDMVKTYQTMKKEGKTDVASMRAGFQRLFDAAAAGDDRALFDRDRWVAEQS